MNLKEATDEAIKGEAIKHGVDGRRVLRLTFNADDLPDYCEKCGAPVDNKGEYNPND